MTFIIKVPNADFQSYIPDAQRFVRNGLVAAFRPSNADDGLQDLSGNGHTLTPILSPVLTAIDAYGTAKNGYRTDIKETLNLTYIVVFKVVPMANTKALAVGSYNGASKRGATIAVANDSVIESYVHLKGSTDANLQYTAAFNTTADIYRFLALTIDAVSGEVKTFAPALSAGNRANVTTTVSAVANRLLNDVDFVTLFTYPLSSSWVGESHISEALIYDKALSEAEIMRQYQYSQVAMAERGIVI